MNVMCEAGPMLRAACTMLAEEVTQGDLVVTVSATGTLQPTNQVDVGSEVSGLVESVAVDPAWQGRGVGRAMMQRAREHCRRRGCYKMALSSNLKRERAHAFYEELGFERHGYSFLVAP